MKINMQIALTQVDIANAIRSYLRSEIPLSEEQEIDLTITYSDREGVIASAIVTNGEAVVKDTKPAAPVNTGVRERGKPSPGRMRRTQAEIAEDEAADKADAEASAMAAQADTQAEAPVDPAILTQLGENNDPPFEVDSKTEQDNAQVDAVAAPATQPAASIFGSVQSTQPAVGIFPNAGNSAPAIVNDDPPPPALNGKSLFANLGQPAA